MKYFSVHRPIGIGCYPKYIRPGEENKVVEIVNFDERTYCPEVRGEAWGYIEYENPIPANDMIACELLPDMSTLFNE